MPGHIHGLIQVEFSILVEDGVRAGRERGTSEGAGMPHSPKLLGDSVQPAPHSDQRLMGAGPALARLSHPKLNKSVTGLSGDTPVLVSSLTTSSSDLRGMR